MKRRGFSLVMTLIVVGILVVLGAGVTGLAQQSIQVTRYDSRSMVAYYAARAGVEASRYQLSASQSWSGFTTPQSMPGRGSYTVTVQPSLPDGTAVPSGCVYVISTGFDGGNGSGSSCQVGALINASVAGAQTLPDGLFSSTYLNFSGGGIAQGWDDTTGLTNSNATVGTNSVLNGAVQVSGGSAVKGVVTIGPGGNTAPGAVVVLTSGTVGGINAATTNYAMPPPNLPADIAGAPTSPPADIDVSGTTALTLTPGVYGNLHVGNSGVLTLQAGDYLFTGNVTIDGAGAIELPASQSQQTNIYFGGNTFTVTASGQINNRTQKPGLLNIYGTQTTYSASNTVTVTGGVAPYYTMYAPLYDCFITGGGKLYGTMVGYSVTVQGGALMYIDTALSPTAGSLSGGGSGSLPTVVSLQRL